MNRRPEFMIEDRVWYIPDGANFAVLATVTGVSRAPQPGSNYFYDLDEPIGHSVPDEELCLEKYKDDVAEFLSEHVKDFPDGETDLKVWRRRMVDFIYSTHVKAYGEKVQRWPWMEEGYYPERTEDEIITPEKTNGTVVEARRNTGRTGD